MELSLVLQSWHPDCGKHAGSGFNFGEWQINEVTEFVSLYVDTPDGTFDGCNCRLCRCCSTSLRVSIFCLVTLSVFLIRVRLLVVSFNLLFSS